MSASLDEVHDLHERCLASFERVLSAVRSEFPWLLIEVDRDSEHVDVFATLPRQPGIQLDISINLQHDELHLNVGSTFWVEWFPCDDQEVERRFTEAVCGLISGRCRVVEYSLLGEIIKAQLQCDHAGVWKRTATWYGGLPLPLAWLCRRRIRQNIPSPTS